MSVICDPTSSGFELTLADGTPVRVRPVVPSDREGLQQGYREMSRTAQYMRFLASGAEISDAQARYFTEVDQRDHIAWCAVEPRHNRHGYGITRLVRHAATPNQADFAIAVIDLMQGKGLGTILLATLYVLAQAAGIEQLHGEVLEDNPVMPHWLPRLGAAIVDTGDPNCRGIRWPIGRETASAANMPQGRRFCAWVAKLRPLVLAGRVP